MRTLLPGTVIEGSSDPRTTEQNAWIQRHRPESEGQVYGQYRGGLLTPHGDYTRDLSVLNRDGYSEDWNRQIDAALAAGTDPAKPSGGYVLILNTAGQVEQFFGCSAIASTDPIPAIELPIEALYVPEPLAAPAAHAPPAPATPAVAAAPAAPAPEPQKLPPLEVTFDTKVAVAQLAALTTQADAMHAKVAAAQVALHEARLAELERRVTAEARSVYSAIVHTPWHQVVLIGLGVAILLRLFGRI